jgi:hypothetical protein
VIRCVIILGNIDIVSDVHKVKCVYVSEVQDIDVRSGVRQSKPASPVRGSRSISRLAAALADKHLTHQFTRYYTTPSPPPTTLCAAAPLHPSLSLRLSFHTQRPCSSNSSPAPPLAAPFQAASRVPRLSVQQHPAQLSFSSAYGKEGVTRPRLVWIHCPDTNGEPARKQEC